MFNKDVLDYLMSKDDHGVFKTNASRILTNVIETRDNLIESLSIIFDVVKKADLEDIFEDYSYPDFDHVINMLSEIIGMLMFRVERICVQTARVVRQTGRAASCFRNAAVLFVAAWLTWAPRRTAGALLNEAPLDNAE